MTRPGSGPAEDGPVGPEALAGLARELERLRRNVDRLTGLPDRVDDVARLVSQLADTLATLTARPGPTPAPTWLMSPTDPAETARLLGELCVWLHAIYLRYPDGVAGLPECWLWHPDVIEELLWLMHAWCAAYQGKGASVAGAGDWHDRQRPGVVRRIRQSAGSCSRERHQTRVGWTGHGPTGATAVPGVDACESIAGWWATGRDDPAPEPPRDVTADPMSRNGGHP